MFYLHVSLFVFSFQLVRFLSLSLRLKLIFRLSMKSPSTHTANLGCLWFNKSTERLRNADCFGTGRQLDTHPLFVH